MVSIHRVEAIDRGSAADESPVGNRLLFVPVVLALLLGALALRESRSHAHDPPKVSAACGADVTRWPSELGLDGTRGLTLCLLNEQRARHDLAPLRSEVRLQLAAQR